MGTNSAELKKIHDLDLDDYVDDATLAGIQSDLVSCDDTIRTIAASPAFEGETQLAVNGALAQLQAEVRKWHAAVALIKSARTTARDSMRTAKPKYDELADFTTDNMSEDTVAVENRRERQAAEALAPMDETLTASTDALREIDLSRPAFDPNRQVDQTPLDELPGSNSASPGAGGGSGSGAGSNGAGGAGSGGGGAVGAAAAAYGSGATVPLATFGTGTTAIGTAAVTSVSRLVARPHTGYSVTQVDRFTSSVNGADLPKGTAFATGRYTVENGRLVPLGSSDQSRSGASGNAGLVIGAAGTTAAAAAAAAAVRGLSAASAAAVPGLNGVATAGSTAALGVNGSTGMATTTAGGTSAQGSGAAGSGAQGAAGRPVMGAPAGARGAGQSRNRRRPHGTYDIPLLEDEVQEEYIGDPGPAAHAGSRETITTPEWTRESDTW
ncbi:hypothetical protein SAMN05216355_10481 [Actinomyces ruminicola]|uniref:Uncharacterized protein n=1 Tax=Actinomyces ruminicola TaxID=332524 RepID=A0A1H0BK84_9ACTO|nr:hypothetical protein [Actinomyces ruminicola]SDN45955.1 hypothetical protein SAMN05216355_10481 [Actinomyces ruminicola]